MDDTYSVAMFVPDGRDLSFEVLLPAAQKLHFTFTTEGLTIDAYRYKEVVGTLSLGYDEWYEDLDETAPVPSQPTGRRNVLLTDHARTRIERGPDTTIACETVIVE